MPHRLSNEPCQLSLGAAKADAWQALSGDRIESITSRNAPRESFGVILMNHLDD
ncbi:hypothetical protein [Bradyrhizobium sp.]|uniref:hypothetical protein n=1 Tax=Bradyrhizobium sp. TaxID=376 RepID=UPI0025C35372|nr:hypothetical protein [Bradyrhizobium sp.]